MTATATFGAGCFWGTQATFQKIPGVIATAAGYEGGTKPDPTYEEVCSHATGHAEVVQLEYDPALVSYDALLDVFWNNHNPTTLNRQGPDVGTQYRSAIFYHDEEQKELAERSRQILSGSGRFKQPVVTQIVPASTFWVAEDYHQSYLGKHGMESCHV
jgi:peptide-methionine (S)-S-oxide reductase